MLRYTTRLVCAAFAALGIVALPQLAAAQSIPLVGADGAAGDATVLDDPDGPDQMMIRVSGLPGSTRFTVFLTHSPITGALPAQFLGEFTTQPNGKGHFKVVTEVTNAFASANISMTDALGIAEVLAAGALINGANTIPLDWIRIYRAEPDSLLTVFGSADGVPGGTLGLTALQPLP